MEKERLVNFIATIMEDSGFNVAKNYKVENQTIDIYGTLNSSSGEVGVVVACKNYEEPWKVGIDVIKDMENATRKLHASKIIIFTTSSYTRGCAVYAQKRNIKLVDRKGLIKIAKNYAEKRNIVSEPVVDYDDYGLYEQPREPVRLTPGGGHVKKRGSFKRPSLSRRGYTSPGSRRGSNTSYRQRFNGFDASIQDRMSFDLDISGVVEFFQNHMIIYLVLLVIISSLISYVFNIITAGPFTGLGRICTSAIVCFGGLALVDRDISNILFRGGIIFFISIIISILILAL